jgi:uncharacterized protein with HEPN domain
MSRRDEAIYLYHILESVDAIATYVAAVGSFEQFIASKLYEDAVVRRLHVAAESMLRLSEATQKSMPEIPWQAIKNFRNLLVHEYLEIDMQIVWDLVHKDLPVLRQAISRALENKNV